MTYYLLLSGETILASSPRKTVRDAAQRLYAGIPTRLEQRTLFQQQTGAGVVWKVKKEQG